MKVELRTVDFDFKYTGITYTEKDVTAKGFRPIKGEILQSKISNTTIFGDYPNGYKFVTNIYNNGTTEGINDVGSKDSGNWIIDSIKNTLQLKWKNGWFDTTTRAYEINDTIVFFDIDSGKWRTTFKSIEKWDKKE